MQFFFTLSFSLSQTFSTINSILIILNPIDTCFFILLSVSGPNKQQDELTNVWILPEMPAWKHIHWSIPIYDFHIFFSFISRLRLLAGFYCCWETFHLTADIAGVRNVIHTVTGRPGVRVTLPSRESNQPVSRYNFQLLTASDVPIDRFVLLC